MSNPLIGVVGLSHLGVTASVGLASLGFQILGVDSEQETVGRLQQGDCIFPEPSLPDLLASHRARMTFTTMKPEVQSFLGPATYTTLATNAVLERKGARTALLTTTGFRDVYAIGRSNRIEAFNLFFHRPQPLTRREMTFEIEERLNAAGEVIRPLDERQVEVIAHRLGEAGVEAVAVCFLHSYANPAH